MKILSIKKLAEGTSAVIKRFPFEVLFALTGTIAATTWTELSNTNRITEGWCARIIMVANLGLLLSLAVNLYTQSKKTPAGKILVLKLVAAVLAVLLIFILNPYDREADRIRFFLISLAFHLLVAFAAFTAKGHVQGFWQFNKALFLRILTSALYSGVLFAGIAAALGAMNFLFNFKFEWDTFAILWVWIVGMFNTLFFLAGVPDDLQALDEDVSYPKGLKVFTQYVLIPLATLYVIILLAYEIKILVQWNLPKGLVSDLILGYAVFGILSILLVYPVREQEENKWLKTYARSFYFLMLPLIVLLLLAVGARVFKYGITEWRYFLIVLAGWLLFITVYFLVSKKQNIKLIPISLSILTLLAVYGPQSAFSVSKYSQQRILVNIFKRNNAFKDGKLLPVDSVKISREDGNRAVATLTYLINHHDLESVAPYLPVDMDKLSDSLGKKKQSLLGSFEVSKYELREDKLEWVKRYLHISRFSGYSWDDNDSVRISGGHNIADAYNFTSTSGDAFSIRNYDYLIDARFYGGEDSSVHVIDGIHIRENNRGNNIGSIWLNSEILSFDIKAHLNELMKNDQFLATAKDTTNKNMGAGHYNLPAEMLDISQQSKSYQVLFKITRVNFGWTKAKGVEDITYVNAEYLIKVK